MRILLVGDYPPDPRLGSAKVYFKLREEFQRLGHSVELVLGDRLGQSPRNRLLRWAVSPILAARAVLKACPRLEGIDVIDAASAEGLWLGLGRRFSARGRPALVARSHGLEHLNYRRMLEDHRAGIVPKPWYRRRYYPMVRLSQVRAAAALSDRLILLNQGDRDYVKAHNWLPEERVDVIAHGVSERFMMPPIKPDPMRGSGFLFCGTWDATKGVHYLARGFERFREQGGKTALTIVGGGWPSALILGTFAQSTHPYIRVVDRLNEDELMGMYRTHDALLFTSTYEGFGMVVPEAMSQGLPVIGTSQGIAHSLIRHGITGLLVPARDSEALAKAMLHLSQSPELRKQLGDSARECVASMTWRRTAESTIECYEKAITQSEGRDR